MLILASNSPRRRELLKQITDDFIVAVSNYGEQRGLLCPKDYAVDCAVKKAGDVFERLTGPEYISSAASKFIVLAADTVVVSDGNILGKPKDAVEARQMLGSLSGRTHSVITGIAVKTRKSDLCDFAESIVTLKKFTLGEIDEYIATGSPFDKAGGYGIQDPQIQSKIISVVGGVDNVIGLPVELVRKLIKEVSG